VEGLDDARRLPTFAADARATPGSAQRPGRSLPVMAAVKAVIDRLPARNEGHRKDRLHQLFLIVGDFIPVRSSKGHRLRRPRFRCRSIVTYLLEFPTSTDPLRLLFERFHQPERVNPPDIDIDFADDRARTSSNMSPRNTGATPSRNHHLCTMGAKSVSGMSGAFR